MLVVIAEKEELKLVEELGYGDYPLIITGVGGLNVIRALKDLPKDKEILNIGYCGSKYFEKGKRLSINRVGTYHEKAKFNEELLECDIEIPFDEDDEAICYTSTDFVTKTKKKDNCVFDMELLFIRLMFPNVKAIKVVSDSLNYKEYKNRQ